MKYIEIYKLKNIFNYMMNKNLIEKISNFETLALEQKKYTILTEIYDWDSNIMNIDDISVNNDELKNNDLFNVKFYYFHANSDINFT